MYCMGCGQQIPDGSAFCPSCGAPAAGGAPGAGAQPAQGQTLVMRPVEPAQPTAQVPQQQFPGQQPYQAQPQYQGPQYQPPQSSGGGRPSTAAIIGVAVAVVAVIAIVVVLVVANPFGKSGGEGSESSSSSASASSTSSSTSSESGSSSSSSSGSESKSSSSAGSRSSGSSSSKSSESASSGSSKPSGSSSASADDYNATGKPSLADFGWISSPQAPSDATLLSSIDEVAGDWKGYISGGGSTELMMNVHIEKKNGAAFVTVKWLADGNGNQREDSTFSGDWTGGTMDVVGSGRITVDSWWQKGGHQYGVGEFIWPSGERPTIYLVRP